MEETNMKRSQYNKQVKKALELYEKAGIVLTDKEKASIEVVDFEKGVVYESRKNKKFCDNRTYRSW